MVNKLIQHQMHVNQVFLAHFLMKTVALDQRNKMVSAAISTWDTRVRRWYSTTSNRTQRIVAPPTTAAEVFFSFHNSTSAAEQRNTDEKTIKWKWHQDNYLDLAATICLKLTLSINIVGLFSKEKIFIHVTSDSYFSLFISFSFATGPYIFCPSTSPSNLPFSNAN